MLLPSVVAALLAVPTWQESTRTREVGVVRPNGSVTAPLRDGESYDFGVYHALLIGIERYEGHAADLRTARNDVETLARVLRDDFGFAHVDVVLDAQATRSGILSKLDDYASRLTERDNLLVYYAGHGDLLWRGERWQEGFWIPYQPRDAEHRWWNWLSADVVNRATSRIRARHVLVISDSCFASALTRDASVRTAGAATPDWIRTHFERPSSLVFTSGADEPVSDDGRDGHSIFAWHLLDALRHHDAPFLPALSLAHHVIGAVMQDGDFHRGRRSQQPVFARHPFEPRRDGQFIFVRRAAVGASGLRPEDVVGLPPGYRLPNHVVVEALSAGAFRYWSLEGDGRVEMVLVPGATFECDGRTVVIEPFLIDRFEVTNERFDRYVDAAGVVVARPVRRELREPQRPATGMSLDEARAFATWAGAKRLPTVDEWDCAAGFDPVTRRLRAFPWGDAAIAETPRELCPPFVGTVAIDVAACGAHDFGGSVREFCEPVPADSTSAGARVGASGVIRGGTHVVARRQSVDFALAAERRTVDAAFRAEGSLGFRTAKSLIPPYRAR
jgi:hypothetical protein